MKKPISATEERTLPRIVLAMHFLVLMAFSSLAVFNLLPLFLERLGGSPRQIGLIVGVFSIAAFLSRPLAGWILGRVQPRKVYVTGLGLMLVVSILYIFVDKIDWLIFVIRTLHGLGFSFFVLAAMLITILAVPEKTRTYAIGVVSTGFLLPLLVVPYIAEMILQKYGFFYFFLVAALLVAIPFVASFFHKNPMPRLAHESVSHEMGFFRLLAQKKILIISSLAFIFEIGLSSSLSFVPLLAHEGTSMRAGYFYTFLGLTAVCLRIFGGKRMAFWGDPKLLFPAFCFLAGGAVLLYFSRDNVFLALSGLVWGIGTGVLYPHLSALAVVDTPTNEKGMVLSMFAASVDLGFAFGPIIFGWLSFIFGVRFSYIPLALIVFFSSSFLMCVGRNVLFEKSSGRLTSNSSVESDKPLIKEINRVA
jgi:MFS family permease